MPELPEVETVVRTLEHLIKGSTIEKIDIFYDKLIDNVSVESFTKMMKSQTFHHFKRIGKYLIFEMDDYNLVVHLRMEGKFYVNDIGNDYDHKHTHSIFYLSNGKQLEYHDTRKFGRMYIYPKSEDITTVSAFKNVGYDAFDERVDAEYLYEMSRSRKTTLKQFLLDQSVMAGVGNIYADEICFRCGFRPETKVYRLTKKDFANVVDATRIILRGAIKAGGTTIRSYTSSLGVDGRFQLQLKVHGKSNEKCQVCGTVIEKTKVGGRGTYYCKKCQRRK